MEPHLRCQWYILELHPYQLVHLAIVVQDLYLGFMSLIIHFITVPWPLMHLFIIVLWALMTQYTIAPLCQFIIVL